MPARCYWPAASPRKCYPAIIPFSPRYSETSPPWPPLNSQRKGSTSHLPAEDRFVDGSEILPTSWERNEYASRCSRNREKTQNHQGIWGKKRSACSQELWNMWDAGKRQWEREASTIATLYVYKDWKLNDTVHPKFLSFKSVWLWLDSKIGNQLEAATSTSAPLSSYILLNLQSQPFLSHNQKVYNGTMSKVWRL